MLDHRLVEYALNVHHNLKLNGSELKHILKELLYDYLPKNIFDRPKWGFAIPMVNWLQTELYYLIEKYLSEENIKELGMVDYNVVLEIKNRFDAGETELYSKLWNLIQLHQWHKEVHLA
jgi:asparagine synthase (glutamine-hydrolysing)